MPTSFAYRKKSVNEDNQSDSQMNEELIVNTRKTSLSSDSNPNDKVIGKDKMKKPRQRHLAIMNSDEEESPESSGDEYTHIDFNNEDSSKFVES
jgi:hypothetical protein